MMKFYRFLNVFFVIVCSVASLQALAQNAKVTGKVTSSDDGSGLPGVSIVEKGTSNGTVTDAEGSFSLNVSGDAVLVFSFVGYASQEVAVSGRTQIDVTLETDVTALSEVVIVGYGQQEKKDLTGSVLSFSTKDFNKGVTTAPQDLLVGKVAGVTITSSGGSPSAGATIRIRGTGSLNANADPLVVIDGFPVDNNGVSGLGNPLSSINPNDIESINVLKDASATAIYGSRASNGVIIITTKKGKEGKVQIGYNGNFSVSSPIDYVDVLSGDEYRDMVTDLYLQEYSGINDDAVALLGNENTDWQKQIYRDAFSHDHNVTVSGSTKNLPYRVSYGYTDQVGILKNTDSKRHSLNINVNPTLLNGDLTVNASLKGSFAKENFGNEGAVGAAIAFDPTQPIRSSDPAYAPFGGYYAWLADNGQPITIATANPVALIEQTDNRSEVSRLIGTLKVDYQIPFLEGLKATVNAGFDISESDGYNYAPPSAAWSSGGPGSKNDYTAENRNELLDIYLNYNRQVGKHKFDVTGGYSYQHFERDGTSFVRNWSETQFSVYEFDQNDKEVPFVNPRNPNYLISLFGRLNYNFGDRYLFTATVRNDASSRFSKDNRASVFPSFAFGWRINNESFMQSVKSVSNLKLRLAYGITGQQDIGFVYPYLPTYSPSTETAKYQFGDTFYNTLRPNAYDPLIKWEETVSYNAGLDFGFFNDKLTGSFDMYLRDTQDLINSIPVAAGSNLSNYLTTNVGSMENRGYEIALNYKLIERENLNWQVGVNFTHNENEITKLTRVTDPNYQGILVGGIAGGVGNTVQNHQVGYPAFSFFVFEQIYDANGKPIEGMYADRTGNGGSVTSNDNNRYRYESPNATYLAGINSNLTYNNFDFSFSGRLSLGNYVYNNLLSERARYSNVYNTNGFFNNVPSAITDTNFSNAQYLSDYYVQDASFFKMDYISAGYNFKQLLDNKLQARIGITVRNAFTITDYSGIDPEVNGGIDNNIYPRPRIFMLNVGFTF